MGYKNAGIPFQDPMIGVDTGAFNSLYEAHLRSLASKHNEQVGAYYLFDADSCKNMYDVGVVSFKQDGLALIAP